MLAPRSLQHAALLLLPVLASASPFRAPARRETATETSSAVPEATGDSDVYDWAEGWVTEYPIHSSCNATLRNALAAGLEETIQLAAHARDHLLRWGNESALATKYFGNASLAGPIGRYERVVSANKVGMTFRCDDPDRNCETQEGWAGHWRGENATEETVICPLSFEVRRPLSDVCNRGYTVAASPLNTYWATDLLHRVFHVPTISEDYVHHYADDHADVLALAVSDPDLATHDSDALQYFAIDAWAYDVAAPGVGCSGESEEAPEASVPVEPTPTETAAGSCHTHSDGFVHCD